MSAEEVMDGNIPLSRELQPIRRIPPVRIEVAVCETSDFSEGAKHVLEDHQEDKQEGYHEGEEQHGYAFCEDEGYFGEVGRGFNSDGGFSHDGEDELFGSYGEEEDYAKYCEDFVA